MTDKPSGLELKTELEDLRARLAEAEEVLRAIRNGEVDALVVNGERGEQVYTLRGADRVYRRLIETMSEGAVTLSADGVILYCNIRLAEILRRPLDQVLGTVLQDYLPPADQDALDAILANARTATSRRQISLQNSEGCLVPVYLSASPCQSEEAEMLFCLVLTDLTEQTRHEQVVIAERLARSILEQAAEAIVVCDEQGRVTHANKAARQFFDGNPLLQLFAEVFPLLTSAPGTFQLAPVLRGETLRNVDVALDRQGRILDFILNAGPLFSGQQILGCVVTLTNITEQLRLEGQFRQAQKMEAVGRLAGGVAHDFNNMLQVINSYSEILLTKLPPSDPLRAHVKQIANAGQRSADLTHQLLAFARKQVVAPITLDLNDTVAGMLKMLGRLIGEDIDLLWKPVANPWLVKIDPSQIDQILANLTVNARDAISGVGNITIETDKAEFDQAYCEEHVGFLPGCFVILAVSDDGCGMDKEIQARLFEPFFTTKPLGHGTGLGLAMVFGIVKQNSGFINVYSEPAKGTTFKIYLPRQESDKPVIEAPREDAVVPTGTETVVLVEDEVALLELGRTLLEQLGYTVLPAGNPLEAIRLVGEYSGEIHLLLTDVVMPGMSGRDLWQRLGELRPGLRCLFMSGYTANAIGHRGILDEGTHFLQKPFSVEKLATKLREALSA